MKKYLLASDSHGRDKNLKTVIERNLPLSGFLFLGDGEGLEDRITDYVGDDCPLFMVRGNNDFSSELPRELVITLGKSRILLTHGNRLGVSYELNRLSYRAEELGCDTAFFGHTHVPERVNVGGVLLINPGSIPLPRQYPRLPSYILIELDDRGELHYQQAYLRD